MANTLKFGNGEWYGKKDTILAYNDLNSNYKPLPFNFSRASKATVINKDGLIETVGSGEPRIDYKDDSKGALLLEPSRSNILLQSNQFDTSWSNLALTPLSSQIGVGGSTDAWLLNVTGNSGSIRQNVSQNGVQTLSVYAKKSVSNWIALYVASTVDPPYVYFDLDNGVVGTSFGDNTINENIESVGDGWYRCSITFDRTISSDTIRIFPSKSNGVLGSNGDSVYIQYAQLEQGSYATSYIPTQGSAVTRLADVCSQTVPDGVIGQTEGTIFVDVDFDTLSDLNMFLSIRPNSSNKIEIYRDGNIIYAETASSNSFDISKTNITVGRHKIAFAYSSGSSAMYINGVLIGSDTKTFAFTSTLDDIYINSRGTSFIEQSNYNEVKIYNTRLSNAELITLTT